MRQWFSVEAMLPVALGHGRTMGKRNKQRSSGEVRVQEEAEEAVRRGSSGHGVSRTSGGA